MAYVTIPKDLSRVQSKVLFGLTKRQVICFGAAAIIGCTCKMKVDTHKSVGVYFFRSIMNMERK